MPEQVQVLLNRVLEWWNKFTSRQKTFIVAISAVIIMAMAILVTVLNQTQYSHVVVANSPAEASEIKDLFDSAGIKVRQSSDSLRFSVDKKRHTEAVMLLGANNIQASTWTMDDVTGGGFSTTEADKQKRMVKYLEGQIAMAAMSNPAVSDALVQLNIPNNDGTLLSQEKESFAYIQVTHNGDFTEEQAAVLAKCVSVGLGSTTPVNISIADQHMNMLYSGDEIYSNAGGSARTQLATKNAIEKTINDEVRRALQGTGLFQKLNVASKVEVDYKRISSTDNQYYLGDDREEGYIAHEHRYDAEAENSGGNIPGTDSNDEGGAYMYRDHAYSSTSESEVSIDRLVNQKIIEEELMPGRAIWEESSIAVSGAQVTIIREEDVKRRGEIGQGGPTWDEYKIAHSERTIIPVEDSLIAFVSNASGIPIANISILAYEENIFIDAEGMQVAWTDVTQIILIVIILGLLAFVVLRSMRSAREEVEEEELNVDRLLQSQPALEDIAVEEGNECKRVIDKFVEENPEAAASLLRNWLNEDWG